MPHRTPDRSPRRPWRPGQLLAAVVAGALAGCGALPPLPDRVSSAHLTDTQGTALGRAVRAADPGDGRSGVRALPDPLEAFAARAVLVRTAERALDVQ